MGDRVYILLDVAEGRVEDAAETLRGTAGVKLVDVLEGRPNVIAVLLACSRRELAVLTRRALASVDNVTEGLQVLPTPYGCDANLHTRRYQIKSHHGEHYLKSTGAKAG